jgi:hypothetical protein
MITADASMYRSKHAGRNRVSGVPVPVMDDAVIGRSATGESVDAPLDAVRDPDGATGDPAGAAREPADNSV